MHIEACYPYSGPAVFPPYRRGGGEGENAGVYTEPEQSSSLVVTQFQPMPPEPVPLVQKLREFAEKGEIMVSAEELAKSSVSDFAQRLQEAEEKQLVTVTKRQFGNRPTQRFVSLRLAGVSLESLSWVLRSLERDEMTPVERAVQSRFKESFGLKLSSADWKKVLDALKSPGTIPPAETAQSMKLEFDVTELNDPAGGKTSCIYPKGKVSFYIVTIDHRWAAVDMNLRPTDIDQEKFKEFYAFLEGYFRPTTAAAAAEEDSKEGAEERCVPGGRYGCAQFVKACGTPRLRVCSLGQLSQFIQFAINEDVLCYQKTLLVLLLPHI